MRSLFIAYLLEDTAQSGGIRIILAQADALVDRGHRVELITKGKPMNWRSSKAEWRHVSDFAELGKSEHDFLIGTFWKTIPYAFAAAERQALHLCQGYEGAISYYQPIRSEIEAVYRLPMPKLAVSRSLLPICRQFTDDVTYIGQIVEEEFFRDTTPPEKNPLRLLVCGEALVDLKGIADAYIAIERAKRQHDFRVIRVSLWPPAPDERLDLVDEYHEALTTSEMTRLLHSCDLLLAPNHREEGFGLPAAEAMASGIPTVVTRIPSYLSFDENHDYAAFAAERDPEDIGRQLTWLLSDAALRQQLRKRGREVAQQFRAAEVASKIEERLSRRQREL